MVLIHAIEFPYIHIYVSKWQMNGSIQLNAKIYYGDYTKQYKDKSYIVEYLERYKFKIVDEIDCAYFLEADINCKAGTSYKKVKEALDRLDSQLEDEAHRNN